MTKIDKLIQVFHKVVTDNIDEDNVSIYINPSIGMAFGGHRRSWGYGDLLVRYKGPIEADFGSSESAVYNYSSETMVEMPGLPSKVLAQGGRDILRPEECDDIFNKIYEQVNGYHQVVINPKQVLDFIEDRTRMSNINEKVVSISAFEVANVRGHFVAKTEMYENELVVGFNTPNGYEPLFIDRHSSLINISQLDVGVYLVVAPVGIVEGKRIVRVVSLYRPGVTISIQHFKSGLLMPGMPRYSVLPGEDGNDIRSNEVKVFPFIEGQEKINLRTAPMISIQLDTFVRVLEPLSEYKKVELLFKDSNTAVLMIPEVEEGQGAIDVAFSPLSTYISGKVLTL